MTRSRAPRRRAEVNAGDGGRAARQRNRLVSLSRFPGPAEHLHGDVVVGPLGYLDRVAGVESLNGQILAEQARLPVLAELMRDHSYSSLPYE